MAVITAGGPNCSWEWTSNLPLATDNYLSWNSNPGGEGRVVPKRDALTTRLLSCLCDRSIVYCWYMYIYDVCLPHSYMYDDIYRPPRSLALPDQFKDTNTTKTSDLRVHRHPAPSLPVHQPHRAPPSIPRHVTPTQPEEEEVVVVPDTSRDYRMLGARHQLNEGALIRTYWVTEYSVPYIGIYGL